MQKYNGQLIRQFASNVTGNAASGVAVTVRKQSDASLATLYATNNIAGATLPNPITTTDKGFFAFYAADGVYTLTFSDSTPVQVIQLQDVAELQSQFDAAVLAGGYIPSGTFSAGATLTQANQVLSDGSSYWRWDGTRPKVVSAGSAPTPTGVGGWIVLSDFALRGDLAGAGSAVLVGGATAASVALATDIANGNFVTPEQFFTGSLVDVNADWLSACQSAVNTGKTVLLRRSYGLSSALILGAGAKMVGISRTTSGFHKVGTNTGTNTVLALEGAGQNLSCFKVDGKNAGSAPDNRLHLVSVSDDCTNFSISQVDCYNATGYGHVTFGSESNPLVTGSYVDCYAENCQVPFEQIGALNVSLYKCVALGVSGRTLSLFHPYAGSKRVTYTDCHGYGEAGAGIEAVVTNGYALGPFTFENSTININGNNSAIVTLALGSQAVVDMTFIGGSYTTSGGQSVTLNTPAKLKAFGTSFDGPSGFNCPSVLQNLSLIELHGCKVRASRDSATDQINGMITNSNNPKIVGGSIEAYNTLAGGKVALLGAAIVSRETTLVPAAASQQLSLLAEIGGTSTFTADSGTLGYVTINLPLTTTRDKLVVGLSISNSTDNYLNFYSLGWSINGAGTAIIVRFSGFSTANLRLHYRIGILP